MWFLLALAAAAAVPPGRGLKLAMISLLRVAASGDLNTADGVRRQGDRLLASPNLEHGVRAFSSNMLPLDMYESVSFGNRGTLLQGGLLPDVLKRQAPCAAGASRDRLGLSWGPFPLQLHAPSRAQRR